MEAILIIVGALALAGIFRGAPGPARDEFRQAMDSLEDFLPTRTLIGVDGRSALALDATRRRVALLARVDDEIKVRTVGYDRLESCEIIENDASVGKAARATDEQGAPVVGGDQALAIPGSTAGTVIDVVDADFRKRSWLVDVLVTVSGESRLGHRVRLLREGMFQRSIRRGSPLHAAVLLLAQEWFGLCREILASQPEQVEGVPVADLSDAAGKLASLQVGHDGAAVVNADEDPEPVRQPS